MADNGHQRDTDARTPISTRERRTPRRPSRAALVAAPVALVATAATVAVGVVSSDAGPSQPAVAQAPVLDAAEQVDARPDAVSRGGSRAAAAQRAAQRRLLQRAFDRNLRVARTLEAVESAHTRRWTTAPLNLWTLPGEGARKVGLLGEEKRVLVTGREQQGREEVVVKGRSRWVTSGYLVAQKPVEEVVEPETSTAGAPAPRAATTGECTNGTSVPPEVSPNIAAVHQAVCAAFPEITTYGTLRSDGEHAQGIAVDIMVSGDRAWQVAEFVRANAAELGVNYVIHARNIWSVQRSSEGWRGMEDRGSATANHYDHVHVTTY